MENRVSSLFIVLIIFGLGCIDNHPGEDVSKEEKLLPEVQIENFGPEESPSMAGNNREDGQSEGQGEGQGQGSPREEPQQLRGGGGGSSLAQTWRNQGTGGEGESNADQGPMGGNSFREWTDGLREAEEMVDVPELQNDIAAIRDRARAIRREARDAGEEPKWDLVQLQIEKPLYEVRKRVQEELSKRTSKEAIVPVDRDPVPDAYSDLVRTYYETLGEGR